MKDIILLLAGAVLGYLPSIIRILRQKKLLFSAKRRAEILKPLKVYNWLIEYYRHKEKLEDLYRTKVGQKVFKIPFLVNVNWLYFQKVNIKLDEQLIFRGIGENHPINKKLINRKIKLKQRIFNDPTLYIEKITTLNKSIVLDVKQCNYHEMITIVSQLEEETIKAIKNNNFKSLPIRDNYLISTRVGEQPNNLPFSVGCVVLLAFKSNNGYEIIIQRRSNKTATYGGYKSVIPSYGLSPKPRGNEQYSIIFYNFIKEFAEELYDYEELIEHMSTKRGDLFWFLYIDEIKEIIDSFEKNSSEFIFTGFGLDVLNGTNTLSYLCIINDEILASKIKKRIKGNWEVDSTENELALELIDITDQKLTDEILNKHFHFGSSFCILRGIEYLKKNNRL